MESTRTRTEWVLPSRVSKALDLGEHRSIGGKISIFDNARTSESRGHSSKPGSITTSARIKIGRATTSRPYNEKSCSSDILTLFPSAVPALIVNTSSGIQVKSSKQIILRSGRGRSWSMIFRRRRSFQKGAPTMSENSDSTGDSSESRTSAGFTCAPMPGQFPLGNTEATRGRDVFRRPADPTQEPPEPLAATPY